MTEDNFTPEEVVLYLKYLNFAWDEELERTEEWIMSARRGWASADKYWLELPLEDIGLPTMRQLKAAYGGRDHVSDLALMDAEEDSDERFDLYEELRNLL